MKMLHFKQYLINYKLIIIHAFGYLSEMWLFFNKNEIKAIYSFNADSEIHLDVLSLQPWTVTYIFARV